MSSRIRSWSWIILLLTAMIIAAMLWSEREIAQANDNSLLPSLSTSAGAYDEDIMLRIAVPHPEAEIFYTLDGQTPDPASAAPYTGPIHLSAATPNAIPVRAQAFLPDGSFGPVASATYFMNMDTHLPKLSIIVEPEFFWDEDQGIYVNHAQRGRDWERPVDLTFVTGEGETGFQTGAGIRIHGGWTRYFSDKKSFRLYFRNLYGAGKLDYPLFGDSGQVAFDHLVLHNSLQDLLLFRNQLIERLTLQMGGYATRSRPVLLFINGRPWGIYYLRERSNARWLAENYGTPDADISDTPNNRGMQSEEQLAVDTVHWENLIDFVLANDLADPDNYAYLQTQMDVDNFIDYYILQMYAGNTDWPHHNVQQFRPRTQGGRWEWTVWDNDFAFDRVDRQMLEHVLNVQHPLGERMVILLNKLLANPEFNHRFITRTADLLNTTLSTPNVLAHIDQIVAQLEADITYEKLRWDIDAEWDEVVEHMRNYAEQRPSIMREHFVETLDLSGTVKIEFEGSDEEPGWIVINDGQPQRLPWQGEFFQDSEIQLQAIPAPGYEFSKWEGLSDRDDSGTATVDISIESDMRIRPRFTPAAAHEPRPGDAAFTAYHANDDGAIEGDWFEIRVNHANGLDLRGWRVTDNDSLVATDEGSLIFKDDSLLADIPQGANIRVVATITPQNSERFGEDGWQNGVLLLYLGNGRIDDQRDPWFNLGPRDNLVLLAPGETADLADDIAIDIVSENKAVTPGSFSLPPSNSQ